MREIQFWRELKKYNDKLKAVDRVQVLGFDFDRLKAYQQAIQLILKNEKHYLPETKQKISTIIETFKTPLTDQHAIKVNSLLKSLISTSDSVFLSNINKDKITLEMIANNNVPRTGKTTRDKETYKNIRNHIQNFSRGNFLAQYGISHVNKTLPTLSSMLHFTHDSPFKGKVVSISPHYFNCEMKRGPINKQIDDFGILKLSKVKYKGFDEINSDVAILPSNESHVVGKKLSKSTDYVLIIRNQ